MLTILKIGSPYTATAYYAHKRPVYGTAESKEVLLHLLLKLSMWLFLRQENQWYGPHGGCKALSFGAMTTVLLHCSVITRVVMTLHGILSITRGRSILMCNSTIFANW